MHKIDDSQQNERISDKIENTASKATYNLLPTTQKNSIKFYFLQSFFEIVQTSR